LEKLPDLVSSLPPRHRAVIEWYADNAGTEQPWPGVLPDGTLIASRAKAIYKPNWTKYAVSVRENLSGQYPDKKPTIRPDGTWEYFYFQEGNDPAARDRAYVNRGLLECFHDSVPVGVMRQTKRKPESSYEVLGPALVAGWEGGFFKLEGFSRQGLAKGLGVRTNLRALARQQAEDATARHVFDPISVEDERKKTMRSIVQRRGQPEFRAKLIEAYEGRCAITGYSAIDALEAAHIVAYKGPETNYVSNGLLLRADVHTLLDVGLIAIDPREMKVIVAPELADTKYGALAGVKLRLPRDRRNWPSLAALEERRRETEL
jgi:putative restriction endonuclease